MCEKRNEIIFIVNNWLIIIVIDSKISWELVFLLDIYCIEIYFDFICILM